MENISRRAFSAGLARVLGALTVTGASATAAALQSKPFVAIKSDHPLFASIAEWKEAAREKRLR